MKYFVETTKSQSFKRKIKTNRRGENYDSNARKNKKNISLLSRLKLSRFKYVETISINTPWFDEDIAKLEGFEKLGREMGSLFNLIRPKKNEIRRRENAIKQLNDIIKEKNLAIKFHNFGSFLLDLYLPESDLDFVVIHQNKYISELDVLFDLKSIFKYYRSYYSNAFVITAKVPVLKTYDIENGIDIDITYLFNIEQIKTLMKTRPK